MRRIPTIWFFYGTGQIGSLHLKEGGATRAIVTAAGR
jgi:hypothetical protein